MSKKKKNKEKLSGFDIFFGPTVSIAKEGDFRFYQQDTYIQQKPTWFGMENWDTRKGTKTLQRYDGKDWKDIPTFYDDRFVYNEDK